LIPEDFFKLVAGNRARCEEISQAGFKVEIDENFAKVEQNCFNLHPCILTSKTEYFGTWQYERIRSTPAAGIGAKPRRKRLSAKLSTSTDCQKAEFLWL